MNMYDDLCKFITQIRPDCMADWLTRESSFANDLDIHSVELLNILALVEQKTRKKMAYEPLLLPNGKPKLDLTIGELADFIEANCHGPNPTAKAM